MDEDDEEVVYNCSDWVRDLNKRIARLNAQLVSDTAFPMDFRKNAYRLEMNVNHPFFKSECDLWLSQIDDATVVVYVFQTRKLVKRIDCDSTDECFTAIDQMLQTNITTYRAGEQALSDRRQFHTMLMFKFNALKNQLNAKNIGLRWTDRLLVEKTPQRGTAVVEFNTEIYKKHPNTLIYVVFNPIHLTYWAKIGIQTDSRDCYVHLEEMHTLDACLLKIYEILLDRHLQLCHTKRTLPSIHSHRRRRMQV